MAAPALTKIPLIVQTEVTPADVTFTQVYARMRFQTQAPDPPAQLDVIVGPYTPADLADPAIGQLALRTDRNNAFLAYPGGGYDATAFATL